MLEFIKSLFKTRAAVTRLHPSFGLLTYEDGIWSGEAATDGRAIRFLVDGSADGPDERLLDGLGEVLGKFKQVEREALDFLVLSAQGAKQSTVRFFRSGKGSVSRDDFALYLVVFPRNDRPDDFILEFTLTGDVDGIWWVEFHNGQPVSVDRDD